MRTFQTLGVASLAFGLLFGCEKRESRDLAAPSPTPAVETAAPADRVPSSLDERQPVSGRDTTTAGAPASTDLYTVGDDGTRHMLHDSILITEVQRKLQNEGVYSGATDGRTSAELEAAIRQYQAKKSFEQTGTLDRRTTEALGLDWNRFEAKGDGIGADVKKVGGAVVEPVKESAKEVGREIKEGFEKADTKLESGTDSTGQKMKSGIEKLEMGAEKAGTKIKEGAEKAGTKIEEGIDKVKDDIKSEPVAEPPRTY